MSGYAHVRIGSFASVWPDHGGAGGLGVLTAVSMLVANDFWAQTGHDRFMATNAFFEHLGLIAGLVLITALSLREQKGGSDGSAGG
jgi:hypothetical protein